MPLRVQYDPEDPSSSLNWLERWSSSNVWKPAPQPKKAPASRSHKKQEQSQIVEVEHRRPKHSVRRIRGTFDSNNNATVPSSSESENPRRSLKKVASNPTEPENPQHELEKVKRSLRKVHGPVVSNNIESEASEKPRVSQGKLLTSAKHDVSLDNEMNLPEKVKEETVKEADETIQETAVVILNDEEHLNASETIEISNDDDIMESPPVDICEKEMNDPIPNGGEMKPDDDCLLNEYQKSNRRSSFPAKPEAEDGPQNTPKVPSYMAATKSAKAKLRGQNSPRISQDGNDKTSATRRHSLPSSTNGKLSSSSPRTQRSLHGSGKGGSGSKSDKAKDGKVSQAEWRR